MPELVKILPGAGIIIEPDAKEALAIRITSSAGVDWGPFIADTVADEAAARAAGDAALHGEVTAEAGARSAADNVLQGNINNEKAARESEDAALLSSIGAAARAANAYTDTEIAGEAALRASGDAAAVTSANAYTDTEIAGVFGTVKVNGSVI